ncbi:MAG: zinc-ribbon domain-containing protein, partial [Myxococcales bacterium]|nr:zinc-ribbon domain-containing protein [Myxococcales bacterium]
MKVVCDNCSAVYKVPDDKLTKPVNKATCRQCGHRMLIPRPRVDADPNERTLVTAVPPTPIGAPPRAETPWSASARPERTLPGRAAPVGFSPSLGGEEVPVFPGTPMPTGARRQAPSSAAIQSYADAHDDRDEISLPPEPAPRRPSLAAQPTAPA